MSAYTATIFTYATKYIHKKECTRLLLIAALLAGIFHRSLAQQSFLTKEWTYREGITANNISKIFIRDNGQLLLCDNKNVAMFDGYNTYPVVTGLGKNVSAYYDGRRDTLLAFTSKGLFAGNIATCSYHTIDRTHFENADPNDDQYNNPYLDTKDRIWCNDFSYVKYKRPSEAQWHLIPFFNSAQIENVQFLEWQRRILLITGNGLFVFNEVKNNFAPLHFTSFRYNTVDDACILNGVLYCLTDNGNIYEIQANSGSSANARLITTINDIQHIAASEYDHHIYAYNSQELFRVNIAAKSSTLIQNNADNLIKNIAIDHTSGIIWMNCAQSIVELYYDHSAVSLLDFTKQLKNNIQSVLYNNNQYYIASGNELLIAGADGKTISCQTFQDNTINTIKLLGWQPALLTRQGIFTINKNNISSAPLITGNYTNACFDGNFYWLIDSERALTVKNVQLQTVTIPYIDKALTIPSFKWVDMAMDTAHQVWLAAWGPESYGMALYNGRDSLISLSEHNKSAIGTLPCDYFLSVNTALKDTVLFTGYGGVVFFTGTGKWWRSVNFDNAAYSDFNCYWSYLDRTHNFWISTDNGINVYNYSKNHNRIIASIDKYPVANFHNAFTAVSDTTFAIAYHKKLFIINTTKALHASFFNRLAISSILVNNQPITNNHNAITLPPGTKNIEITFSNLEFNPDRKVIYYYAINQEALINNGTDNKIRFPELGPGTYHVKIYAADAAGNFEKNPVSLTITAKPFFYQTGWFMLCVIGCLIGLIVWIAKREINKSKRREALQRKINETEMQLLRSQMNPHFLFNTLNSINSYIVTNDSDKASDYLTSFSKLMRAILENSKQETISLSQELAALKIYIQLEQVRLNNKFDFDIHVDNAIDTEVLRVPPLIIQPFVENAIWHGIRYRDSGGLVKVAVIKTQQGFDITIRDNGIGREAAVQMKVNGKLRPSRGIEITQKRIAYLNPNDTLFIHDLYQNGVPAGTEVVIKFSCNDQSYHHRRRTTLHSYIAASA